MFALFSLAFMAAEKFQILTLTPGFKINNRCCVTCSCITSVGGTFN